MRRWREDNSSFDCLPSGQCFVAYDLSTGPVYGTEVSTFNLNTLATRPAIVAFFSTYTHPKVVAGASSFELVMGDGTKWRTSTPRGCPSAWRFGSTPRRA
ncbi:MAG TPA: hypothetical protein VKJ07_24600 [Mycobacteriales bacterium]|nr:hypothetical protein [Mycobacteriales bacterium]